MTRTLTLVATVMGILIISMNGFSSEGGQKKTTTYQVPTKGTIIDVIYLPEFDEWWVKCREGKGISIYTYDKRSDQWGRARFIPAKPIEKPKESVAATKSNESTDQPEKPTQPGSDKGGAVSTQKQKPDETKPPEKPETEKEKKKWWDPLKLLKGKKTPLPEKLKDLP